MGKWENSGYLRNYCNQWPENSKVQTTISVNESKWVLKVTVKVISFFQVLYILYLYEAQISGEHLQDHWSSGFIIFLSISQRSTHPLCFKDGNEYQN